MGQGPSIPDQKQKDDCRNSGKFSKASCETLALAFATPLPVPDENGNNPALGSELPLDLKDPANVLSPFIVSQREKSFLMIAKNTLATSAMKQIGSALNTSAQVLSTKAAVPQLGAASSSSASTDLTAKPTTTDLISLAAESGAFTDTVNGNTLTAKANVDGVRRYLNGKPFVDLSPTLLDALQHIDLTATFTIAQSGSAAVAPSGSATSNTPSIASILLPSNNVSFNSLSVNYTVLRPYSPHSTKFLELWQKALGANASALAAQFSSNEASALKLTPARVKVESDEQFQQTRENWFKDAETDRKNNNFKKFVADFEAYCAAYVDALRAADPDNYDANILAINASLEALKTVNNKVLDDARGKPLLTAIYTYSTPQNKPATHAATLTGAYVFRPRHCKDDKAKTCGNGGTQLTANAAGTWFATIPAGAKYGRVQSYQFSGELDQPIGPDKTAPRAIFSVAGYGQYQYSPTVLNITAGNLAPGTNITLPSDAQVLLGAAGWIGVAQTKMVFNIGKGASIPVAVKWSNKTDLVQGSDWKGQFGFSYDLSALPSMLASKK